MERSSRDSEHKHRHHSHHHHRHDEKHGRTVEESPRERKRPRLEVADDAFPIEKRPAPAAEATRDPEAQARTRRLAGLFAAQLRRISAQGAAQQAQDAERARITAEATAEAQARTVAALADEAREEAEAAARDAAAVPEHDARVVHCWHTTDALAARFRVTSGPHPIYWAPKDLLRRLAAGTLLASKDSGDDKHEDDDGTVLADLVAKDLEKGVVPRALLPRPPPSSPPAPSPLPPPAPAVVVDK